MNEVPAWIEWFEPWQPVGDNSGRLAEELRREVPPTHMLSGCDVLAVARRVDCDDVLFLTSNPDCPLVVVHLTWGAHPEQGGWPIVRAFPNWEEWVAECQAPDHREYSERG